MSSGAYYLRYRHGNKLLLTDSSTWSRVTRFIRSTMPAGRSEVSVAGPQSKVKVKLLFLCVVLSCLGSQADAQAYFFNRADFAIGTYPTGIAAADFNRDGILDLAIVDTTASTVSVLLGRSDGTFGSGKSYPTGFSPSQIAVGDFNQDGSLDLLVSNYLDGTVSVFFGDGKGSFTKGSDLTIGSNPYAIAVADFNHDGHLVLAITNGDSDINVLLGKGDGTFDPPASYP